MEQQHGCSRRKSSDPLDRLLPLVRLRDWSNQATPRRPDSWLRPASGLNKTSPRSYQKKTICGAWFHLRGRCNDPTTEEPSLPAPAIHRNKTSIRLIATPWLRGLIELNRFQFSSLSMTIFCHIYNSSFIKLLTKSLFLNKKRPSIYFREDQELRPQVLLSSSINFSYKLKFRRIPILFLDIFLSFIWIIYFTRKNCGLF